MQNFYKFLTIYAVFFLIQSIFDDVSNRNSAGISDYLISLFVSIVLFGVVKRQERKE